MSGADNNAGEQLADWLKEAGRRTQDVARANAESRGEQDDTYNSPASLHRYVEELAGRKLQSHAEVLEFLKVVAGNQPEGHAAREQRRMVREVALLAILALSYLHYYYWDVQLQIAALRSVNVFVPAHEVRPAKTSS
ncbi:MAG: hypothetical protein ACREU5_10430 [Burkholderiales bacterium]